MKLDENINFLFTCVGREIKRNYRLQHVLSLSFLLYFLVGGVGILSVGRSLSALCIRVVHNVKLDHVKSLSLQRSHFNSALLVGTPLLNPQFIIYCY